MNQSANKSVCWGVFFLCLATLMYELILTRIFSVLMWYHFASMAISLALFGFGVAALTVQLRPRWFQGTDATFIAARGAVLFGLSVALFFIREDRLVESKERIFELAPYVGYYTHVVVQLSHQTIFAILLCHNKRFFETLDRFIQLNELKVYGAYVIVSVGFTD